MQRQIAAAVEAPGIAIDGTGVWGQLLGLVDAKDVADGQSKASQQALDMIATALNATLLWVWQASADSSRPTPIAAGRADLRIDLAATAAGVAIHPAAQTVPEFPEMQPLFADLREGRRRGAAGRPGAAAAGAEDVARNGGSARRICRARMAAVHAGRSA